MKLFRKKMNQLFLAAEPVLLYGYLKLKVILDCILLFQPEVIRCEYSKRDEADAAADNKQNQKRFSEDNLHL